MYVSSSLIIHILAYIFTFVFTSYKKTLYIKSIYIYYIKIFKKSCCICINSCVLESDRKNMDRPLSSFYFFIYRHYGYVHEEPLTSTFLTRLLPIVKLFCFIILLLTCSGMLSFTLTATRWQHRTHFCMLSIGSEGRQCASGLGCICTTITNVPVVQNSGRKSIGLFISSDFFHEAPGPQLITVLC